MDPPIVYEPRKAGLRRCVLSGLLAISVLALAVESRVDAVTAPQPAPCDVRLGQSDTTVDGSRQEVPPGTVICLEAGTRGNIKLANLHGTAESPIVVRNDGGPVVLTGTRFEAAILLLGVTHIRITGTGVAEQCGAEFSAEDQRCGIEIDGATKGIKLATGRSDGPAGEIEIDHVGIHRVSSDKETRGIAIHPIDRQVVAGIRIHHNFISNTLAEGVYIGSEPRSKPYEQLGKVDRVEISYNRLEQIGYDGIKVKVAVSGSSVHHNVITDAGVARYERHQSGITVAMSDIDVHHNTVMRAAEGIKSGRARDDAPDNALYRNVVADVTLSGIDTTEERSSITHNTVVRSDGIGIRARGSMAHVVNNIVTDADRPLAVRSTATAHANLITSTAEAGFVDPENGDFSLLASSPAVDTGSVLRRDFCVRPGMRVARPMRFTRHSSARDAETASPCRSDLGAFELTRQAPSATGGDSRDESG